MNYHPKHKSNSRTAVWIGAGVLAAVAIGAIIFIIITLRSAPISKEEARAKAGIVYDSAAIEGGWDNLSPEEIAEKLNEKVCRSGQRRRGQWFALRKIQHNHRSKRRHDARGDGRNHQPLVWLLQAGGHFAV